MRNKRNLEGEHAELSATSLTSNHAVRSCINMDLFAALWPRRPAKAWTNRSRRRFLRCIAPKKATKSAAFGRYGGYASCAVEAARAEPFFATVQDPTGLRPRTGCGIQTDRFPASRFLVEAVSRALLAAPVPDSAFRSPQHSRRAFSYMIFKGWPRRCGQSVSSLPTGQQKRAISIRRLLRERFQCGNRTRNRDGLGSSSAPS